MINYRRVADFSFFSEKGAKDAGMDFSDSPFMHFFSMLA